MPKYVVLAEYCVKVEADDPEQAGELADEVGAPRLCSQCSGYGREVGIDLGDWEPDDELPTEIVET